MNAGDGAWDQPNAQKENAAHTVLRPSKVRKLTGCFIVIFLVVAVIWGGVKLYRKIKKVKDDFLRVDPQEEAADKKDIGKIRAKIREWKRTRWKADVIEAAKRAKGEVSVSDLTEKCATAELQPVMDLIVGDYVLLVNGIDAYADANNEREALANFCKRFSLSGVDKMLVRSDGLKNYLKNLRNTTSRFDLERLKGLGSDAVLIGKVTLNMIDVCGLAKDLLTRKP